MKTRLFGWMIAAGMTLLTPLALQAQGIGLQVADLAEKHESGQLEVTPGATVGKHLSFYGVREAYTFSEELRAFIDMGAVNVDDSDFDFAAQAGALATLPCDTDLCDLGVRAAAYFLNTDREDIFGGSLMLVSSGETVLDSLYVYGGLGVDLSNRKSAEASNSRTELNPALSAGVLFNFTDSVAAYVEVSHVDSAFIGAGIRFR